MVLLFAGALALAGCASTTTTPPAASPFTMTLTPSALNATYAGQPIVFLVTLGGSGSGAGLVHVEARAPGAAVGVVPPDASVGSVVEVTVVAAAEQIQRPVTLTVNATRGSERHEANVTFEAWDPMAPPVEKAASVRDQFVQWLAVAHPDLNITPSTPWTGAFVHPILIVTYYAFYSDKWEMGVRWHVMIPPYDWAEVYLRERFVSAEPQYQWKVDSVSAEPWRTPHATPTEGVWR